ncbi:MAG TPA: S41 family peptidase [Flavilitoribacter sp.]|nr:S41 family peptidase [Flavilitoribacter sp.]HMQ90919.1 S41 family peptidase [Flavilitoribacter sp.]
MRHLFFLISGLFFVTALTAQSEYSIESLYKLIKRESIHRMEVDWDKVDQAFRGQLAKAKTRNDSMRAFVTIFKEMKDPHSSIYCEAGTIAFFNPVDEATFDRLTPMMNRSNSEMGRVKTAFLENKYAYIQVPGFFARAEMVDSLAQMISDSISRFDPKKTKGFIIDLRLNKGGSLYPMLSGLGALLGDGPIGGETGVDDKVVRSWAIENGNFVQQGTPQSSIRHACGDAFVKKPVVILTGPITISSGALVAVAFKGRKKTRIIGEPTGEGYTTSNGWFKLGPRLILNLASAYVSDRDGHIYRNNVTPDETVIGGDNFNNPDLDAKVAAAIKWLR